VSSTTRPHHTELARLAKMKSVMPFEPSRTASQMPVKKAHEWRLQGSLLSCEREGAALFKPVSFHISAGESLLLSGPNGIGKTTLLEAIAGLRRYTSGTLRLNNKNIQDQLPAWWKSLCYIGHKDGNKKALSCLENLKFTARLHGHTPTTESLLNALDAVGLAGYEHHLAGNLSAGQKKRLSLARLPLVQAPVWILDEPFVNLDVAGNQWLLEWLDAHLQQGGMLFITAHDNQEMHRRATYRQELYPTDT